MNSYIPCNFNLQSASILRDILQHRGPSAKVKPCFWQRLTNGSSSTEQRRGGEVISHRYFVDRQATPITICICGARHKQEALGLISVALLTGDLSRPIQYPVCFRISGKGGRLLTLLQHVASDTGVQKNKKPPAHGIHGIKKQQRRANSNADCTLFGFVGITACGSKQRINIYWRSWWLLRPGGPWLLAIWF